MEDFLTDEDRELVADLVGVLAENRQRAKARGENPRELTLDAVSSAARAALWFDMRRGNA